MKTGLDTARGDILVFVDADMESIKPEWVTLLTQPIIRREADICKAEYKRKGMDAPVTKLVAKPLLKALYPDMNVSMPLEGEIAARRETFHRLEFREDWGIDVGLIISAHKQGLRIKNVFLGEKIHKPSYIDDIGELSPMAENIIHTIMESKNGEIMANIRELVTREMEAIKDSREQSQTIPGFIAPAMNNNPKPKAGF
jgi:glucosyl-3-phosphoglycerate synthase